MRTPVAACLVAFLLLALAVPSATAAPDDHGSPSSVEQVETHAQSAHGVSGHRELGAELGLLWTVPFVGILLSIALFPLLAPSFWHHHYPKVSLAWSLLLAVPFLYFYGADAWHAILHIYLIDYVPFIILLWGLFTVAGGIVVRGSLAGTPVVNTILLFIGTALASWIGTTGAAMVLIRPVLRANATRKNKQHVVVFFIFLVANVGGSLTPLGDPPLFLGFLHSVPFFWTTGALLMPLLITAAVLLVLFFLVDSWMYRKEGVAASVEPEAKQPLGVAGLHNLVFLLGIIGAVLMSGVWKAGEVNVIGTPVAIQNLVRDALIIVMGVLSLVTTARVLRRENGFSWGPIAEVAYLFAGIFMTIIPALEILKAGENGALAAVIRSVQEPWQYFWVTGALSSFLDNAPTYLTFFNTALGSFYPGVPESAAVTRLIAEHPQHLLAISAGAVYMGANTYIGNAPNFMVKSIAEEAGVEMPSFFGYIVRWSAPILLPTFVLVTLIFFRG
ncbi:MAG: sodium:proton antiporter [Acidobacteria bacterium]|nr:sodium:proton antiporter [Acidobacteriota bacterium]